MKELNLEKMSNLQGGALTPDEFCGLVIGLGWGLGGPAGALIGIGACMLTLSGHE